MPRKSAVVGPAPRPVATNVTRPSVASALGRPDRCSRPLSQPSRGTSASIHGFRRARARGLARISRSRNTVAFPIWRRPSTEKRLASSSTDTPRRSTPIASSAVTVTPPRKWPEGMRSSSHERSEREAGPSVRTSTRRPQPSPLPGPRARLPSKRESGSWNVAESTRSPSPPKRRSPSTSSTRRGRSSTDASIDRSARRPERSSPPPGRNSTSVISKSSRSRARRRRRPTPSGAGMVGTRPDGPSAGERISIAPSRTLTLASWTVVPAVDGGTGAALSTGGPGTSSRATFGRSSPG